MHFNKGTKIMNQSRQPIITKSQLIGLLLNLGFEPQKPYSYNCLNENNERVDKTVLPFVINTESLLNIFPDDSEEFNKIKKVAKNFRNARSTVSTQFTTIDLDDDKKNYNNDEVFELLKQLYNGKNIKDGYVAIFPNPIVDKHMEKYRNAVSSFVNGNIVNMVNGHLKHNLYNYEKSNSCLEHLQQLKTDNKIFEHKLNYIKLIHSYTPKISVSNAVYTLLNCHPSSHHNTKSANDFIVKNANQGFVLNPVPRYNAIQK